MTIRAVGYPGAGYLTPRLANRERSHRRMVMFGIAILLLLGVLPVMGHHGPERMELALTGVDHLGALCLAALHMLLAPVHGGFHVVLGAGLLYALWDRLRAWRQLERTLAPLDARLPLPGQRLWDACVRAGVSPRCVRIVRGLPNPAFTVGVLAPRIYIAAELPDRLTADEVASVLAHEAAHVARRDPLRFSLLRGLACALFWIPALSRLAEDLRDESEIEADDAAASRASAIVLASAIVSLAQWGDARLAPRAAVGFCRRELLDRRVRRLLGQDAPITSHMTRFSTSVAIMTLLTVWGSGLVMAHPLPGTTETSAPDAIHCAHHADGPFSHLFCRRVAGAHGDCPHTGESLTPGPPRTHRH